MSNTKNIQCVPAVSVIVPVFNRCQLVVRAVQSLRQQEFDEPYEIIVVDDGSTDGSAEAVIKAAPEAHVVRQVHQGAAVARYTGVAAARADFVTFLDSDDIAFPHRLSRLWQAFHEATGAAAAFGLTEFADTGRLIKSRGLDHAGENGTIWLATPLESLLRFGTIAPGMTLLTRQAFALQASKHRGFYRAANDYDFQLRLARFGPFVGVLESLGRCDRQPDGLSLGSGESRQRAFVLLAADEAFRASARGPNLARAVRDHVISCWPATIAILIFSGEFRLACLLLRVGVRHDRLGRWMRPLFGCLAFLLEERLNRTPIKVGWVVATPRRVFQKIYGTPTTPSDS